jgi:hypothetical protein
MGGRLLFLPGEVSWTWENIIYLLPDCLKKNAMGNIKFILIFDKKFVKHGISGVILFNNGR